MVVIGGRAEALLLLSTPQCPGQPPAEDDPTPKSAMLRGRDLLQMVGLGELRVPPLPSCAPGGSNPLQSGDAPAPALSGKVLAPPCGRTADLDPETRFWVEGSEGSPHPPPSSSPRSSPSPQQEMGALAGASSGRAHLGSAEDKESAWVGGSAGGGLVGWRVSGGQTGKFILAFKLRKASLFFSYWPLG